MKKILLFTILLININCYSQLNIKDKKILKHFVLGYDNEKSLKKKVNFDEIYKYTVYDGFNELTKIYLFDFQYKLIFGYLVKVELLLVNDKLYSVRYYPNNDRALLKYEKYLDTSNLNGYILKREWFNQSITVIYEIDGNYDESFIHYDNALLKKYPQYKNKS